MKKNPHWTFICSFYCLLPHKKATGQKELSFLFAFRTDNSRYLFKWLLNRYSCSYQIASYSFKYLEILTNTVTHQWNPFTGGVIFPSCILSIFTADMQCTKDANIRKKGVLKEWGWQPSLARKAHTTFTNTGCNKTDWHQCYTFTWQHQLTLFQVYNRSCSSQAINNLLFSFWCYLLSFSKLCLSFGFLLLLTFSYKFLSVYCFFVL